MVALEPYSGTISTKSALTGMPATLGWWSMTTEEMNIGEVRMVMGLGVDQGEPVVLRGQGRSQTLGPECAGGGSWPGCPAG